MAVQIGSFSEHKCPNHTPAPDIDVVYALATSTKTALSDNDDALFSFCHQHIHQLLQHTIQINGTNTAFIIKDAQLKLMLV